MPIGSRWIVPLDPCLGVLIPRIRDDSRVFFRRKKRQNGTTAGSSPRSCACGDLWLPEATFASRWQCSSVPGIHRPEVGPLGNHTIFGGRNDETWAPFLHSGLGQNWDMEPPHPSLLHYLQKQNKRWCPACDFCWYSLCPYAHIHRLSASGSPLFPCHHDWCKHHRCCRSASLLASCAGSEAPQTPLTPLTEIWWLESSFANLKMNKLTNHP